MKPINILKTVIFMMLITLSAVFLFACDEDGARGAEVSWYEGEEAPAESLGNAGDYYYQSTTSDVWLRKDDSWSIVTNLGLSMPDDSTVNPPMGDAAPPAEGGAGTPVIPPADKIYVGYLGYIYYGKNNTGIKTDISEDYVYENTTHITNSTMQEYFTKNFTSPTDTVALMTHYNSANQTTFYSGVDISEITVYSDRAGSIKIGTEKLRIIADSAIAGKVLNVKGVSYAVKAGLNTIKLECPINVHTDETVVLSGVGLYYMTGLGVNDAFGDFALLSGAAAPAVIKKTEQGKDKLAVSVKLIEDSIYTEVPIDKNAVEQSNGSSVFASQINLENAPYAYVANNFKKKTITKIGIPVAAVESIDDNQTFTLYVCTYNTSKTIAETINGARKITVKLPKSELGSDPSRVNKWIYIDLSDYNVYISNIDTLAFGKSDDKVKFGKGMPKTSTNTAYNYVNKNTKWGVVPSDNLGIYFDIYEKSYTTYEKHVAKYEGQTAEKNSSVDIAALKKVISGKKLSILGDSISTYGGYTTGSTAAGKYNSTIAVNECWFYENSRPSVKTAEETWWLQAINQTGMSLLVNNSCSGDKMTYSKDSRPGGLARCEQLHKDAGTVVNPDIIAVYFGTNDRNANVSLSDFEKQFNQMIDKIQAKYPKADIFVFSMQDTNIHSVTPDEVYKYNNIVYKIADEQGLGVVKISTPERFTKYNFLELTIDGEHPNSAGMDLITEAFIEALYEKYVK